jgi:hypothetical protein
MNDKKKKDTQSELDEILRELEERFATKTTSYSEPKKSSKSFFSNLTQTQIVGTLTLILLVIGSAVGIFLSRESQELRQRAQESPYPECAFNPTCSNPDCAGDMTCIRGLCLAAVGGVPPYSVCIFNGQLINFEYCANLSCGPVVEKCSTSAPTASACYGNNVGSSCTEFNGTCTKTSTASDGSAVCACVANGGGNTSPSPTVTAEVTTPPVDNTGNPTQPTTPPTGGNTSPSPTTIVSLPSETPRPTNTSVPVNTNTPVPGTPGAPTNTPVPVNTNTPVPLNTLTPTPTFSNEENLPPEVTSTPNPTSASTATPQPTTQTQIAANQDPQLPSAGGSNKNVQVVLAGISLAVLVGAIALLFFL